MSSVRRVVNTQFWDDDKVINEFSPEDKYFMLYLLTNKHTTQLGIYTLVPKQAAFELGYSIEAVRVLLERFENKYGIIRYSDDTCEVAIRNYLFHSVIKGGKPVMDCLLKEEKDVADRNLLWFILDGLDRKKRMLPKKMNETVLAYMGHLKEERTKEENLYKEDKQYSPYKNDNDNDNERYVNESYHESYHESLPQKTYSFNNHSNINNFAYLLDKGYKDISNYIKYRPVLTESIKNWMEYKDDRSPKKSNHYTEIGMKGLLTEIVKWHKEYGDEAVGEAIIHTISNQWQGIVWDWMEKKFKKVGKQDAEQNEKVTYTDRPERWMHCPKSTWQKLKPYAHDDGTFDWSSFDTSNLDENDRQWMRQNDM